MGWDCTGTVSRCQGLCGAGCEEEAISSVDEDTGRIITFSGLTCTVTETRKTNITCTGKCSPTKASPDGSFGSVVD